MPFMMLLLSAFVLLLTPYNTHAAVTDAPPSTSTQKIGVLLVNHGSRSATWRNGLLQLEARVAPSILNNPSVKGLKTAFMEYTEPSIATRLKEFDREGFTDVILVPIFLTVSPHTFDDIPTIAGMKEDSHSVQQLKIEKIERYTPKAKTHLTPPLDFTDMLQKNLLRRVTALSHDPANEALVLIGYGDETYDKEWIELFKKAAVGSSDQCNTLWGTVEWEGDRDGTYRASGLVCGPESGPVAAVETGAVVERDRPGTRQARRIDS